MAYLFGDANNASAGKMGGFMAMNRCPSLADAIEIANGVVSEVDRGGSQVRVYEGDFSSGTDGFIYVSGGAIAGNINGIGGEDNWCRLTRTAGTAGRTTATRDSSLSVGYQHKGSVKFYNPEASTVYIGWYTGSGYPAGGTAADDYVEVPAGSSAVLNISFLSSDDAITFSVCGADGVITNMSSGQIFYFKDVSVNQTGITADLPPSSLQLAPGQWLDESGNKAHVLLPDGMRVGEAKTEGVLFAENEFAASAIGQPICADVPVLPADYQVTLMMKATVEATFNLGDGSDDDYYAAGVTIGTDWEPVTLLKHASDGTNRKIVITPTASYDGTVSTAVKVVRLT